MNQVSLQTIKQKAETCQAQGKKWHFHLLTPTCKLNSKNKHAFVLENTSDNEIGISFSDKPQMQLGQKLLKLLHGIDVSIKSSSTTSSRISKGTREILERAKTLNQQGKFWHHHTLLPQCQFNPHPGRWTILFEDQEKNETFESVTKKEPRNDLQLIETLYYQQRDLS